MESIKEEELEMIKSWVKQNTHSSMYPNYLEEYWFHQKDELRKLLNNQNIYEHQIEFKASKTELKEMLLDELPREFYNMLHKSFDKIIEYLEIDGLFKKIFGNKNIYLERILGNEEEDYNYFIRNARRYFLFDWNEKTGRWEFTNNCLSYGNTKGLLSSEYFTPLNKEDIQKIKIAVPIEIYHEISWRYALKELFSRLVSQSLMNGSIIAKNSKELLFRREDMVTLKIYNPSTDKTVKLQNTDKPLKMIKNIFKLYKNVFSNSEWEYIKSQIEQAELIASKVLNTSKLKGTLCLSIHPMDFMTLSDNGNDWSSCMSWSEEGCYRAGTLEMLNSHNVIVAYLKSSKTWKPCYREDYKWASKKWRELFVVTPFLVAGIKGYPYHSSPVETEVIKIISELAKKNWGIEYDTDYIMRENCSENDEYYRTEARFIINEETKEECFEASFPYFECNEMYNDTSGNDITVCYKKNLKYQGFPNLIYYGEAAYCINCGDRLSNDFEGNTLSCYSCREVEFCEECGYAIEGEENCYYINGRTYCSECVNLYFQYDDLDGEYIDNRDAIEFTFLRKDFQGKPYHVSYVTKQSNLENYDIELVEVAYANNNTYNYIINTKEEKGIEFLIDYRLIKSPDLLYLDFEIDD